MEETEARYLAQLAQDFDGCDKARYQFISQLGDEMIRDPARAVAADWPSKWWHLGYYKLIEHYRSLAKVP